MMYGLQILQMSTCGVVPNNFHELAIKLIELEV